MSSELNDFLDELGLEEQQRRDDEEIKENFEIRGEVSLTPTQGQIYNALFKDFYKTIVVCAGRRTGKSFVGRMLEKIGL